MTDTGFANHPYFVSNGYNIERVSTATTEHPLVDTSGHGTGESANVLVMAPDCHFIGVKHNDYSAAALETALAQNPRIITNSCGWDIDNQSLTDLKKLIRIFLPTLSTPTREKFDKADRPLPQTSEGF